jgi:tripeptidyl-peptidase-1
LFLIFLFELFVLYKYRWARPSWQDAAVQTYLNTADNMPASDLFNANGRGFPDVSAQGTNYVVINNNMTLSAVAGTSASSPTFAGIIALLNDARMSVGKSPMGFLNPFIYENPSIFNDITEGNNPGCSTKGFYAARGWDPITGNGTPNFPKMLEVALALP